MNSFKYLFCSSSESFLKFLGDTPNFAVKFFWKLHRSLYPTASDIFWVEVLGNWDISNAPLYSLYAVKYPRGDEPVACLKTGAR